MASMYMCTLSVSLTASNSHFTCIPFSYKFPVCGSYVSLKDQVLYYELLSGNFYDKR